MSSPAKKPPSTPFNSLTLTARQQRQLAHETCRNFTRSPSKGNLGKIKKLFAFCGIEVFIEAGFHCDYGDKISIGDKSYFNINCTLLDGGNISFGANCFIGPNVQILTINHATSPTERLNKLNFASDVNILDNVWIGAGAIILPGVTIGESAVIGAGSVVSKDVPANCLFAGNPAIFIKSL